MGGAPAMQGLLSPGLSIGSSAQDRAGVRGRGRAASGLGELVLGTRGSERETGLGSVGEMEAGAEGSSGGAGDEAGGGGKAWKEKRAVAWQQQ